ncbi:MAG: hypothetical protein ACTSW1_02215 [Candidatus Hodarchaeales archaeon]
MDKERFKGFLRLSLAHHPLCWHYRKHTVRVGNVSLCLGCTAFYSGIILSIILALTLRMNRMDWETLIAIATFLYLPTILRLVNTPLFNSDKRGPRFLYRLLLGVGVGIGIVSIMKAPNVFIGIVQIILGLGLYLGISLKRIFFKDFYKECEDCTFSPSSECPGFAPFHLRSRKHLKTQDFKEI